MRKRVSKAARVLPFFQLPEGDPHGPWLEKENKMTQWMSLFQGK